MYVYLYLIGFNDYLTTSILFIFWNNNLNMRTVTSVKVRPHFDINFLSYGQRTLT
jgi:hypothetical protein